MELSYYNDDHILLFSRGTRKSYGCHINQMARRICLVWSFNKSSEELEGDNR
jgi:hypothetical protein